jgi:uroporphyrinogen-III synthase
LKTKIFISKNLDELPIVEKLCDAMECSIQAESLIRFEALPFKILENPDIVCFTSPRSVWFYFQNPINSDTIQHASVGPSTAARVRELGHSVAFIGSDPGDPEKTSKEFAVWVGERTVLFPESDRSLGSLSKGLTAKQVMRIPVYKTVLNSQIIPQKDIYIFTSPSNSESFLLMNKLPQKKTLIAWGKTTANYLLREKIEVEYTLSSSSENELVAYLESVLTSL